MHRFPCNGPQGVWSWQCWQCEHCHCWCDGDQWRLKLMGRSVPGETKTNEHTLCCPTAKCKIFPGPDCSSIQDLNCDSVLGVVQLFFSVKKTVIWMIVLFTHTMQGLFCHQLPLTQGRIHKSEDGRSAICHLCSAGVHKLMLEKSQNSKRVQKTCRCKTKTANRVKTQSA